MPNTLVHFALQVPATRALSNVDMIKWSMLGCIVPDMPWILQRGVKLVTPGIDPYDLRIYCAVQASLMICLMFSAFAASISRTPLLVFTVVGINSAVHLSLDAMEIKWANGVNIIAPFDWHLWNAGLVWPEHWLIGLLSAIGVAIAAFYTWLLRPVQSGLSLSVSRIPIAILLLLSYLLVPLVFIDPARENDIHFVASLDSSDRAGKIIEIDRTAYFVDEKGSRVKTFAGEEIDVIGNLPERSGQITLKGRFDTHDTIRVEDYHVGTPLFRDGASILALALMVLIWSRYLRLEFPWLRSNVDR